MNQNKQVTGSLDDKKQKLKEVMNNLRPIRFPNAGIQDELYNSLYNVTSSPQKGTSFFLKYFGYKSEQGEFVKSEYSIFKFESLTEEGKKEFLGILLERFISDTYEIDNDEKRKIYPFIKNIVESDEVYIVDNNITFEYEDNNKEKKTYNISLLSLGEDILKLIPHKITPSASEISSVILYKLKEKIKTELLNLVEKEFKHKGESYYLLSVKNRLLAEINKELARSNDTDAAINFRKNFVEQLSTKVDEAKEIDLKIISVRNVYSVLTESSISYCEKIGKNDIYAMEKQDIDKLVEGKKTNLTNVAYKVLGLIEATILNDESVNASRQNKNIYLPEVPVLTVEKLKGYYKKEAAGNFFMAQGIFGALFLNSMDEVIQKLEREKKLGSKPAIKTLEHINRTLAYQAKYNIYKDIKKNKESLSETLKMYNLPNGFSYIENLFGDLNEGMPPKNYNEKRDIINKIKDHRLFLICSLFKSKNDMGDDEVSNKVYETLANLILSGSFDNQTDIKELIEFYTSFCNAFNKSEVALTKSPKEDSFLGEDIKNQIQNIAKSCCNFLPEKQKENICNLIDTYCKSDLKRKSANDIVSKLSEKLSNNWKSYIMVESNASINSSPSNESISSIETEGHKPGTNTALFNSYNLEKVADKELYYMYTAYIRGESSSFKEFCNVFLDEKGEKITSRTKLFENLNKAKKSAVVQAAGNAMANYTPREIDNRYDDDVIRLALDFINNRNKNIKLKTSDSDKKSFLSLIECKNVDTFKKKLTEIKNEGKHTKFGITYQSDESKDSDVILNAMESKKTISCKK